MPGARAENHRMIPNIVRGSDPAGLVRYLFGKGRRNEHTDQHLVCASGDMFPSFDMDGKPAASYAEIGRRFDRRYRVRERKDDPFPPDMRGKNNPEREHGRKRVWHCSLAIKAGHGILTDQEWEAIIRDYLTRMNIIDGDDDQGVTWLAVRHGLSANGNDHVHIMVQLAADDGWINPYHDRINAQKSCRRMEKTRPELVELARSDTGTRVSWQYGQWRQWAEWKARNEYGDDEGWDALDGNDALRRLLGTGEDRRASQGHGIPTALMYLSDDDAPAVADLETTWYDARRNNPNRSAEWRLYYKDCEPIRMARPGDLMCFGMLRDNRLLIIIAQHDSTAEAQAKWLFGIDDEQEGAFRFHDNTERELDAFGAQIFEALGINVEVRDDTYLPEMIGRWGYRFPSNEEFAAFSQSSLTDVDPTHDDPDDVVIEYYDRSYLLFKLYERAVIQHDYDAAPFVSDGVIDVDSFTSFYTSVRNRRMSRAGKVLEIHIAHILDARGIEYEAQARTENGKKPDFLFPSQAAYEDPAFPEEQLRMLASKTSIKDRFRQVADEANRIRDKHLFTLTPGDVTHPKLAQLDELHIHLVMPKVVKESYDDLIQGETMTFSRFIEEVQGLQAGRPQSLTLL